MKSTSLYRFFDIEDSLLYVGITHRLNERLSDHKKEKPWHEVARVTIEHFPDREAALAAEAEAIRTEHPLWNVVHNRRTVTTATKKLSTPERARSLWPYAYWISGSGHLATVAHCKVTTVLLHRTQEQAQEALDTIDRLGCGGGCERDHWIFDLDTARYFGKGTIFPDHAGKWRDLVLIGANLPSWTSVMGSGRFAFVGECDEGAPFVDLFRSQTSAVTSAERHLENECVTPNCGGVHWVWDLAAENWENLL